MSKGYKDGNRDSNFKGQEVSYQDVLKFYLYGGMIYLGVKNWRRALEYFQYVCLVQTNCQSAKLTLISA